MKAFRQCLIYLPLLLSCSLLSACNAQNNQTTKDNSLINQSYQIKRVATFDEPWAMAELADGRLLITERRGKLKLFDPSTLKSIEILGLPEVAYGGQGGLGDIVLHPDFANNHQIYLSYAETRKRGIWCGCDSW